jgi:hypothetical protein
LNNWNGQQLFYVLGKPKANVDVTGVGSVAPLERRAQVRRFAHPGTTADHAQTVFVAVHTLE